MNFHWPPLFTLNYVLPNREMEQRALTYYFSALSLFVKMRSPPGQTASSASLSLPLLKKQLLLGVIAPSPGTEVTTLEASRDGGAA